MNHFALAELIMDSKHFFFLSSLQDEMQVSTHFVQQLLCSLIVTLFISIEQTVIKTICDLRHNFSSSDAP